MQRRKFLRLGVTAACVLPLGLFATDYRVEKPDAWTAHTVEDAIKALYGDVKLIESKDLVLKMPEVSSSGSAVPVSIKSTLQAKSVSLFQNANPESAVAVWTVPEDGIVDYALKLKLKTIEGQPSKVTVVLEGIDGNFYTASASITVRGGCEG